MPSNKDTVDEATKDPVDEATKNATDRKAGRMENRTVEEEKKPPFYIAPGCSVTSQIGILSGDTADEAKAEYFSGGKETLDALIKSKHVLKG